MTYLTKFGKSYATDSEFKFRMALFAKKDKLINEWNSKPDMTHKLGHNMFSDKTDDETKKMRGFRGKRDN